MLNVNRVFPKSVIKYEVLNILIDYRVSWEENPNADRKAGWKKTDKDL